ncbi:type II toxin-antitoxin system PemK/MazF family toxin [Nostoc sp. FACHB-280]|uniref:type II toxin-antitoxin system PemK/MazF family toxin n=1 Tax=Nostoc sp. FACHB-280 TaxID=2692839 RepID=UPI00168B29BC|nr:type II toxin-antitoxin system PemK/MazF family toxin [Nostoc sp. FACHB-280]MBD2498472.1 type II toxin-antitoxin system PemK/MazF family toxin [Nostoc sp. FACHB-280]
MTTSSSTPRRGDIWLVNFDPTLGAEIKKIRPAVVVSSDGVGKLPIKLIAPITDWKEYYAGNIWHVKLEPDTINNLTKTSAVDVLQLRGMDVQRLIRKVGECSSEFMEEIATAIAGVVEYF